MSPGLLKSDLVAPGVNILAAWGGDASPSRPGRHPARGVQHPVGHLTSMATPHVSGVAAVELVRDPAATPFAMGAGFINPGVDVFYGPTHERARSRGAMRGSLQHLLHGAVRPVRPVAVQNNDDSTNDRLGGTPSGQARVGLT